MDASGAQPSALRLPTLLPPRMVASQLEPICWSDMVKFWMVLEDAYGMGGMKARSEQTDEGIRELLMKLAHVWSDNAQNFQLVQECVQVIDITTSLTLEALEKGTNVVNEPATQSKCWLEPRDIFPMWECQAFFLYWCGAGVPHNVSSGYFPFLVTFPAKMGLWKKYSCQNHKPGSTWTLPPNKHKVSASC